MCMCIYISATPLEMYIRGGGWPTVYTFFPLSTFFAGESFHTFLHDLEIPPPPNIHFTSQKNVWTPPSKKCL